MSDQPLDKDSGHCQEYYPDLICVSSPDRRRALFFRRRWWRLKKMIWHIQAMGFIAFVKRKLPFTPLTTSALQHQTKSANYKPSYGELNLQPGEWVEVRSEKEIFSTLNDHDKHEGLQFTKDMRKYCGRRYRVLKRVNKILLETTGELRTLKNPTLILDGVFCDGSFHAGCDRTCACFWREIWLKRVPEETQGKLERDR